MRISVCIITRNEELNIEDCLKSVAWADEIILVDSASTDRTVELALKFQAKVFNVPFRDYSFQKNSAIEKAAGDWIFFIDADERATSELSGEIQEIAQSKRLDAVYAVRRRTWFLKKPLFFSGTQQDCPIRFFPRLSAHFEQPVHERLISELPLRHLQNPLLHYTTPGIRQYFLKFDRYITLEVKTMREQKRRRSILDFTAAPPAKFCYLYFLKLGILDGVTGFLFAALSAYYHFQKSWRYYRSSDSND